MTFYRKYRPQTIEELDNEEIRKRLTAVLSSKSLPHAFLFTGPKGTGKTSAARIIAKAINCINRKHPPARLDSAKRVGEAGKTENTRLVARQGKLKEVEDIEPCNHCDICKSITNGTSLDILEIDAASNRGIDEIRDLREKIKLSPSLCKYKVYIIDEVHMLTAEAFNAILKTLEEPPEHAIFILCTTEINKLPETITSRCLRFNFKKGKIEELKRSYRRIATGEKIKINEEALTQIAKASDGSFREGAKILEQLSFENKEITNEAVKEFLGKIRINQADQLLDLLATKNLKEAILWISSALQNGADLKIITIDLLEILRNYLITKVTNLENEEVKYGLAYEKLRTTEIKRLIELFSRAYLDFRTTVIPQLPLELATIEYLGEEKKEIKIEEPVKKILHQSDKTIVINFEKVNQLWPTILEAIKPLNHSVHAVLKSARPLAVEENILVIEAFYKFHKERLEEPKVNLLLTKVISDKLGCQVGVKCVLGEGKTKNIKQITLNKEQVNEENKDEDLAKMADEIFK